MIIYSSLCYISRTFPDTYRSIMRYPLTTNDPLHRLFCRLFEYCFLIKIQARRHVWRVSLFQKVKRCGKKDSCGNRCVLNFRSQLFNPFNVIADLFTQVPVPTVSMDDDNFIHYDKKCPKYDKLYEYYLQQSPEAREIFKNYGHMFPHWFKMSGVKYYSLESVPYMYKRLMSEAKQDKP